MRKFYSRVKKFLSGEGMRYLFFGGLTTLVSLLSFRAAQLLLDGRSAAVANVISFICAVSFAYVTNKLFVFRSMSFAPEVLKRELSSFISARLLSFAFEEVGIIIADNVLHLGEVIILGQDGVFFAKIVLSVVVVVMNYVLSKFFIFKEGEGKK